MIEFKPNFMSNILLPEKNFCSKFNSFFLTYIIPIEPAVNPIMRKNENSAKSLGK